MKLSQYFIYLVILAGTTYFIRVIPFAFIKKKIKNTYIQSFLEYIPYAVLASMTIPTIFYSAQYTVAAIIGFEVAVILAYFKQSMVKVAIAACITVYIVQIVIQSMA